MSPSRLRGAVLLAGAALTALLVDGVVPGADVGFHWLPLLLGLTLLAAAAASRSRGPLWGPGLVLLAAGATLGVWFEAGRGGDDYRLVPLVALGLGLGGVLAAALSAGGRTTIGPMSVALPTVLLGALALLDQTAPGPLGVVAWPYAAGLALWGLALVLRPPRAQP